MILSLYKTFFFFFPGTILYGLSYHASYFSPENFFRVTLTSLPWVYRWCRHNHGILLANRDVRHLILVRGIIGSSWHPAQGTYRRVPHLKKNRGIVVHLVMGDNVTLGMDPSNLLSMLFALN